MFAVLPPQTAPRQRHSRSPRFAIRIPCQLVRLRDFKLVGKTIADLSEQGALVDSGASVLTGESLIVSFRAPFSNRWIDAEAVVARVIHGRRTGDLRRSFGVEFTHLTPEGRRLLHEGLWGLPAVRTARYRKSGT
ncbi:MAG: PilZ domain-containing protein [Polyangiaceae bacterium]|nr:PilZ domain-containing protein [Polyangiaceae bacterium]